VADLEILEQEEGSAVGDVKDAIVLLNDATQGVKRLDGKTGRTKWTYQDTSGDTPFQVSTSATNVYYISLHTPMLGASKLRVTALNPATGKKVDQYTLNTDSDISSREQILFAGANSAAPLLAWTDKSRTSLKVNIIGTKGISTFAVPSKGSEVVEEIVLHAPTRIHSSPHFLVEYQTSTGHSAEVFYIAQSTIKKAYSLPHLASRGTFSTSTADTSVFFTRITSDEVIIVSSTSHGVLGRWPITKSASLAGAYPVHAVSEVAVRSESAHAVRAAVLFSNGLWALIRNGDVSWTRPEFLAGAVSAVWAELPEEEALAHELEVEGHQNVLEAYVHRVKRHVRDLEHLPAWLQALPNKIIGSVLGKSQEAESGEIPHDTFGFHKLVVVATDSGRLAALDAGASGSLVWNIDLHQLSPETSFEHPTLKALRGYIVVSDKGLKDPLLIEPTTGGLLSRVGGKTDVLSVFEDQTLISFDLVDGELKGFVGRQPDAEPLWTFVPPNGERIVGVTSRPLHDPVASIGKVLGDRRVLYKYLNPNLALVTAVSDSARSASVYLLDSASGNLLYTASHPSVDVSRPIPSAISENWFSYSFTIDSAANYVSRGYQLVVAELFESEFPDDRGPLGSSPNSSALHPSPAHGDAIQPYVLSQTYQIPEEISHMTVSQTKQGITSRELIVTLPESDAIVGIPRYVIDPRRPVGRDPTTEEASEGLSKYAPMIPFDPKWHLTHKMEVAGVKDVITSPALLESTSLVFAYGLDIFGTRLTPSFAFDMLGKGFNKVQMLGTVAALAVGVGFVAPLVRRKQINGLWQVV
jgi:hypothetical protein